jgi:hypothetical protein
VSGNSVIFLKQPEPGEITHKALAGTPRHALIVRTTKPGLPEMVSSCIPYSR